MAIEFQEEAKSRSEGEPEVFETELSQMQVAFENDEFRKDVFYKGMLILVYSYFESMVNILTRNTRAPEKVKAFCRSKNIHLSEEAKNANEWIGSDVHVLRNHIVHEEFEKPRHVNDIKRISEEREDIIFSDNEIRFIGSKFIHEALSKEELILRELCRLTGHHNRRIDSNSYL